MQFFAWTAALLLAVASTDIKLDPASGVWFPPYASSEAYLYGNDPAHTFSGDTKKSFDADPKLAKRVCAAVSAWRPPANATSNPALQQKKTMLDMMCAAKTWQVRTQQKEATEESAALARLERELSIATGETLDAVGRQLTPAEDRLRKALAMVAAHPSNSGPANELISAVAESGWFSSSPSAARVVSEFYGRRARPDDASYAWLSGYRYALFYSGDYAAARTVMERIFSGRDGKSGDYDPLFAALLDRIDGHPERYRQLIRNCPKPSDAEVEALHGYKEPEIHCRAWVDMITARAMRLNNGRLVPALQDVLREDAASPYLIVALNAARDEMQFDPESAKRHFQRIVDVPEEDVPSGIRSGALRGLELLGAR